MEDEKVVTKREKPARVLEVTVISLTGAAALVEWQDKEKRLRRATIPAAEVVETGKATEAVLEAGVPYGVAWHKVEVAGATPQAIEDALHIAGIWTKEDLFTKAATAIGVLQSLYQVDLGALATLAGGE